MNFIGFLACAVIFAVPLIAIMDYLCSIAPKEETL